MFAITARAPGLAAPIVFLCSATTRLPQNATHSSAPVEAQHHTAAGIERTHNHTRKPCADFWTGSSRTGASNDCYTAEFTFTVLLPEPPCAAMHTVKSWGSCTGRLRLSKNLALSSSDESRQPAGASSHQLSHSVPTLKARTRSKDFSNTKRFGVPPSLEDPAGDSSKNPDPKVPRQPGHPSWG
ncbi:hypothetical protein Anapl_16146 [Anas platyrhynchos]|uniref:Uncharacterized protein n=1 Tax=Anas platyrhynchos TaxID=8839 RepID=R0JBG9_ANAPL|nr:hypothetical protein Anapl_16146 [Anas platyrhynchos]